MELVQERKQRNKGTAMERTSFRVTSDQLAWLNQEAAERNTTMGHIVRSAIWFEMQRAGDVELLEHEET
jgi:hypothetical protein